MHTKRMKFPPGAQWIAILVATGLIGSLFELGKTSLAVGLIPSPWDKLAHAATFGAIAFFLWLSVGQRWLSGCAVATAAIAIYDEWRQLSLPGREADLLDLFANGVGIALAVAFAMHLQPRGS